MRLLPALFVSLLLAACIPIPRPESTPELRFGPQASPQEQQTRTFEALWKSLEENYIYYDQAHVDWAAVHTTYTSRILELTNPAEFESLIHELEADLPEDSITWQSRTERIQSDTADTSFYEGIGAFVGYRAIPEPHIVILSVIAGSPAERAGLQAHDSIYQIDNEPVRAEEGLKAVERIRGPAGSPVKLEVSSPGGVEHPINVRRTQLTSTVTLTSRMLKDTNIGYVLFPPLGYKTMRQEMIDSLEGMTRNRHLEGLILDLRIASSLSGWPLQDMLTLFADGIIGEFYDRHESQIVDITGEDVMSSQSVPLAVLVGQHTSGFPEIFASGVRISKGAIVVGQPTAGAVETTSGYYLPDGSRLFVESTSFNPLDHQDVGREGLLPDVHVDTSWDEVLPDQDPVLEAALKALDSSQ